MRTRIFNKMTANEVEAYLARGGNTIFVAVGVVEVHGAMPIDVEQIVAEGFAVAMAEKGDGLAMINLPYFFPGGTIVSNATVQVSVRESINYLMMLARSLVAQGFRKIFFVSGHGPAALYIDAMCRDFFQETKIHVCHLNSMGFMRNFGPKEGVGFEGLDRMACGAYKMLGQIHYLPIDPNSVEAPSLLRDPTLPRCQLEDALRPYGGKTSIYYEGPEFHGGGRAFHSEQERLEACEEGEALIRSIVDRMDLEYLKQVLDRYHAYVQDVIQKYPRMAGKY